MLNSCYIAAIFTEIFLKMKYLGVTNFIDGSFRKIGQEPRMDVFSPVDGSLLSTVPMSDYSALNDAVAAAKNAFPQWSRTAIKERAQIFYEYRRLLIHHLPELSWLINEENGKTYNEARAEIEKVIELTEFACSLPQLVGGDVLEVSRGIECKTERTALGVVASIVPFNFPSMVPHWTIPNALMLGNTMIIKPSEQVPLSMGKIAELLQEAGLPAGVFNIVHGNGKTVEAICDHPDIKAVSFVGSTRVAKLVYKRASANFKRVLSLGGAKNHLIVLPDADVDMTASNIVASATGCAGQRCMAGSILLAVNDVEIIIDRIVKKANEEICGINMGAIINKVAKERIEKNIEQAVSEGAKILLDGRNKIVEGKENGYYVGPTIIDYVQPHMSIIREEIFGPVLAIVRVENIAEALAVENANPYGNSVGIFTQSGNSAKYISDRVSAGMVGINIGVPVPREPFSFGGWNDSKFGALDITGKDSIEFWTKLKKVTTKWNADPSINWMS